MDLTSVVILISVVDYYANVKWQRASTLPRHWRNANVHGDGVKRKMLSTHAYTCIKYMCMYFIYIYRYIRI